MVKKKILIFGATGQIGRHLIRKLTKNNYKVICQTRNAHKAIFLKTSGSIGYIDIKEAQIFDYEKVNELVDSVDIVINLIGILLEDGKANTFKKIHTLFPDFISKICKKKSKHLIHTSSLGVEYAIDSEYAISKTEGENKIQINLPSATIIKPSLVYSVNDMFTTKFMSLLNFFPIFPIYYGGKTKFTPIHASELTNIIFYLIEKDIKGKKIELIGPEVLSFLEILQILSKCIDKKRIFLPMPLIFAKISAKILEKLPNPLLTIDQLNLLKYDNIKSKNNINNFDIGIPAKLKFEEEIKKYAYNWREGGQFSVKDFKKVKKL